MATSVQTPENGSGYVSGAKSPEGYAAQREWEPSEFGSFFREYSGHLDHHDLDNAEMQATATLFFGLPFSQLRRPGVQIAFDAAQAIYCLPPQEQKRVVRFLCDADNRTQSPLAAAHYAVWERLAFIVEQVMGGEDEEEIASGNELEGERLAAYLAAAYKVKMLTLLESEEKPSPNVRALAVLYGIKRALMDGASHEEAGALVPQDEEVQQAAFNIAKHNRVVAKDQIRVLRAARKRQEAQAREPSLEALIADLPQEARASLRTVLLRGGRISPAPETEAGK